MEGSSSPKGSPQGHSRNKSVTKGARPRSSTKGPLDLNDPLSPQPTPIRLSKNLERNSPSRQSSPHPHSAISSPVPDVGPPAAKDFSFLLRPEIYHPLTPLNVPLAFRNSPKQPTPDTPIQDLLSRGHYRAAAIAAVQELTSTIPGAPRIDPTDHARIFNLLYIRLTCLTLIDATPLAAQEVKAFEDLNNPAVYVDAATGEHLVPWDLRVLNVRLQALGFGDPRRAVMSYHELVREARDGVARAAARRDNSGKELWKERLNDLGIRMAGALVEMDDLVGAGQLLATLRDRGDGKLVLSRALLWLHLGNADEARRVVEGWKGEGGVGSKVVLALAEMADGDFGAALDRWRALREDEEDEGGEMVGMNMAVCLLYLGRMEEARSLLEDLVGKGFSSRTLLSNLATIYELCTERGKKALKLELVDRVAAMDESATGWEKVNADFKL
ncbi:uncharacterized protein DNG_06717 [Cephalotrichum gorgonifer]|uniref:Trafficking protein particle complex subunit 12 n=1 Tax=Cephalotrichum gorgonifer TaxID=2041049 RepID=A0AAE8SWV3_9PEZI|nr:uncharacterized protein DNG_06717 [Cephalotrichum gorgonifer]